MGEGLTDLKKELELEKSSKADLNREFNECKVKCAALEKELSEYKSEVIKYNLNYYIKAMLQLIHLGFEIARNNFNNLAALLSFVFIL